MSENNWVLDDFDAAYTATLKASGGGAKTRAPIGDYRVRITEAAIQAKKGANPHNMLLVTFEILAGENEEAIGQQITCLYAGSRQSPPFMQRRLKQLMDACQIKEKPSQRAFVGRELDATIVWELSKATIDPATGEERRFVNDRLLHERVAGAAKPAGVNAKLESRPALRHLEMQEGGMEEAPTATEAAAPWDAAPQRTLAAVPVGQPTAAPVGWRPETEADGTIFEYRAIVKMGGSMAQTARDTLASNGWNPDGEIDLDQLAEPTRGQFLSWQAARAKPAAAVAASSAPSGLPPLNPNMNGPKTGTRRPQAR
jgi:hypothetical protein